MVPHYIPKTHRKIAVIVLALCSIIAGIISIYIGVYLPSPTHSIQLIARSMHDGNEKAFSEMVDEKALSSQIFDALTAHATLIKKPQPLLHLALTPLREDFENNAKTYVSETIAKRTEAEEFKTAATALNEQLHDIGFPLSTEHWHYVSASHARDIDDHTAYLDITVHNDRINTDLTCTLIMEKIDKNRWRITGVHNFEDFLFHIDKAVAHRLEEINKPVQDKIDQTIQIAPITAQLLQDNQIETSPHTLLRIQYKLSALKKNQITHIEGIYTLRQHKNDKPIYEAKLMISGPMDPDTPLSRTIQFLLNPLIPAQYALLQQTDISAYVSEIKITAIHFKDGTTWKLAETLPET